MAITLQLYTMSYMNWGDKNCYHIEIGGKILNIILLLIVNRHIIYAKLSETEVQQESLICVIGNSFNCDLTNLAG